MFRVQIDVLPYGQWRYPHTQTLILGANDGTGDWASGNYDVTDLPPDTAAEDQVRDYLAHLEAGNCARIEDFPRGNDQAHLPSLAIASFRALGLDEVYTEWAAHR